MKKLMAGALMLSLGLFTLGCGGTKPATPVKKTTPPATTSATTPAPDAKGGAADTKAPAAPTTPEKPK